ncbi:DNA-binding protein RFX7-like isoform X2 [Trichomycterus rosablanca]|uniref:DNA-binding protein RFX7-like isoform X2 n=1 Tax=Trichomycterus rosablanca TaxID=2290929 RepID=UPI002F350EA2
MKDTTMTESSSEFQQPMENISTNVQNKVNSIVREVQEFTDSDKHYLYLQLPKIPKTEEESDESFPLNKVEQLPTYSWIRSHLEEHADSCLPKEEIYETYRKHCEDTNLETLSTAKFGKVIREVFPGIVARRLGGRGQSRYYYSGIRRRTVLNMALSPRLEVRNHQAEQLGEQEVTEAACRLICDWAQKVLKRPFHTVEEIARHLVEEQIVEADSSSAVLVTSTSPDGGSSRSREVNTRNEQRSSPEDNISQLKTLKKNISRDVQDKVETILGDIEQLKDEEKRYLYVQLPLIPDTEQESDESFPLNKVEQLPTYSWIRSHLEEHTDSCLPKEEIYETYRKHCHTLKLHSLSTAIFGKVIREVFPGIVARRLGGRGQSRYYYSGIRRRTVLNMALSPRLEVRNHQAEQLGEQEVTEAACRLICDWAQKVLKRPFHTVEEIARHLVEEQIVEADSSSAVLVTSTSPDGSSRSKKLNNLNPASHRSASEREIKTEEHETNIDDMEQHVVNMKRPVTERPAEGSATHTSACKRQKRC